MKSSAHFDAHTVAWKAPQPKPRWGWLMLLAALGVGIYQLTNTLPSVQRLQMLEAKLEQTHALAQAAAQPQRPSLDRATSQEREQLRITQTQLQHALKRDIGALLISLEHTLAPGVAWRRIEWQGTQVQHANRLSLELEAKNPEVLSHWRKDIAPSMPLWRSVTLTQEHMLPPQFNTVPLLATLEVQLNWDQAAATLTTASRDSGPGVNGMGTQYSANTGINGINAITGNMGSTGAIQPPLVPSLASSPAAITAVTAVENTLASNSGLPGRPAERRTP